MTTNSVNTDASSIINQLNSANKSSSSSSSSSASSSAASSSIGSTQANFLALLTTQLQNQDPLNPMDNSEMTSQLAQISTVQGINQLNTTLTTLLNGSSTQQTLQAAALVGHGALVGGDNLQFSDGDSGAIGGFNLASAADVVKIQINDSNGNAVRTITLDGQDAGAQNFVWDGTDDNGATVAAGNYTFSVSATQAKNSVTVDPLQFGYISGVVRNSTTGDVGVDVGNYGRFTLDDIKQII